MTLLSFIPNNNEHLHIMLARISVWILFTLFIKASQIYGPAAEINGPESQSETTWTNTGGRHDLAEDSARQANLETACWGLCSTTGHYGCPMMMMTPLPTRVHYSQLELRPILPAVTPLALLALWLAFPAVTPQHSNIVMTPLRVPSAGRAREVSWHAS